MWASIDGSLKSLCMFYHFPLPFSPFGRWWQWRLLRSDSGSSDSITFMAIAMYFSKKLYALSRKGIGKKNEPCRILTETRFWSIQDLPQEDRNFPLLH